MTEPEQIKLTHEQAMEYTFGKYDDTLKKLAEYERDPRPQSEHHYNCMCLRCEEFFNVEFQNDVI